MTDDDIKDLYGDAHRLMNAIEYDEKLDHLDDKDFEVIWLHIKEHYKLK